MKDFELGSTRCLGDGLIAATVYFNGVAVGEITGDNGTQPDVEPYFPTLEEWWEGLSPAKRAEIERTAPEEVTCPVCGEVIYVRNAKYEDENPNSSSAWYSQLEEEHRLLHEREDNASFMADGFDSPFTDEESYNLFGIFVERVKIVNNDVYLLNDWGDITKITINEWDAAMHSIDG